MHMAVLQQQSLPPEACLNILVIGAGLGGLAAAISCAISGHKITVLESAKELAEVGAGLQITPNGSRLLRKWDLPQHVWDVAAEPARLAVHRYSGELLADDTHFSEHIRAKYPSPFIDLHRVDLQRALHDRAVQLGVAFHMDARLENVDFSTATVSTSSGQFYTADLIIGADGLWSRTRQLLFGPDSVPSPTGDLAYRIVLRASELQDPASADLLQWIRAPQVHFWVGPHSHVVAYSLRAGQMFNIVLLCPDDLPSGVAKQPGSMEEMRQLFSTWDPLLQRFLAKCEKAEKWRLMQLHDELPSWVNKEGNLVLIGDSCHPMLPYLAQGANSALEDGAVLGALLERMKTKQQMNEALERYQQLRKARGEQIKGEAEGQRRNFHLPDGIEQQKRDNEFKERFGREWEDGKGRFPSRW